MSAFAFVVVAEALALLSALGWYLAWTGRWKNWSVTFMQPAVSAGLPAAAAWQAFALGELLRLDAMFYVGSFAIVSAVILAVWQPNWAQPSWLKDVAAFGRNVEANRRP